MKTIYVIAYDITSNRRRNKIAELLENHGQRINLSVFECELTFHQYEKLIYEIYHLINSKTDTVKIYPLTPQCYLKSIVLGRDKPGPQYTTFVE